MAYGGKPLLIYLMSALVLTIRGQEYTYKCKFLNYTVECSDATPGFDIKLEMKKISQLIDESGVLNKVLGSLTIRNSSIEELPENAFGDMAFKNVEILGEKLSKVHTRAFSENMITHLDDQIIIRNPSNIENSPPEYDLFKAFNSLKNIRLVEISLKQQTFHEIPDNAFGGTQDNLKYLYFGPIIPLSDKGFGLSRIGSGSFSGLSNVYEIWLDYIEILNISSDAFKTNGKSDERLFIYLENCLLNDNIIEVDSFVGANRPVTVDLGFNEIHFIREEKFSKFLNENKENKLDFTGNRMDCEDIQTFTWLFNKKEQYEKQIAGARCYDRKPIWDKDPTKSGTAPLSILSSTILSFILFSFYILFK